MQVGDSTKGMQAFEKAIKLKPGPLVWNDVAYFMSLSKIQLEKAQQYAESAVTTTAAELRNVELDQIELADLGLVSSLAAVATRPVPEAKEGLTRLGKPTSEASLASASKSLSALREVKFPFAQKTLTAKEAHFYVVLVPSPTKTAQVSEVKFINGDDKLVPVSAGLKSANFNFTFPDNTTTKIVRRGTLVCDPGLGQCVFSLASPDSISSVE